MALLHRAELHPEKLELLAVWLPTRGWYRGQATAELVRVAAYRFDDPAGAVGIETILVRAGDGPVHQVPLTYRGAPLDGGDEWLVGTTEHSVLGPRWVYDACGDPVYAAVLTSAILGNTDQAELFLDVGGQLVRREPSMTIARGGAQPADPPPVGSVRRVDQDDPTVILTDAVELAVVRRLDGGDSDGGESGTAGAALTGTWSGQPVPTPLAYAKPL
jgi:hypothetical protein